MSTGWMASALDGYGGGDSEYLGCSYNGFSRYQMTGYCKIEEENYGFLGAVEEKRGQGCQAAGNR